MRVWCLYVRNSGSFLARTTARRGVLFSCLQMESLTEGIDVEKALGLSKFRGGNVSTSLLRHSIVRSTSRFHMFRAHVSSIEFSLHISVT